MRRTSLWLAVLAVAVLGPRASAHHSHNAYAISEFTHLEAAVTETHGINPRSWVYIEVKDQKGEAQTVPGASLERV